MRTIIQGDEEGCGFASLRNLLCRLSHNPNYAYLTLEGHPPYSLETLRRAGIKEGVSLSFVRVNSKESLRTNKDYPILLLFGPERDCHMVVALRRVGNSLLLDDPAEGRHFRSLAKIIARWNGIYGRVEDYQKQPCPYHPPKLGGTAFRYGSNLLLVASQVALYAGFYLMNGEEHFLITVLLLTLFGLLNIASRLLSVLGMKAFDRRWLQRIYDPEAKRLEQNYRHYYAFKQGLYINGGMALMDLLSFFLLSFLVGWNNLAFFASIGGMAVYLFLESFFYRETLLIKKGELERREKCLFASNEIQEKKRKEIAYLSQEAYKLGDYFAYGELLFLLMSFVLALIPSFASGTISLNYYLFHFFALTSLGGSLRGVYGYLEKRENAASEKDYFQEYFVKR